jgi:hypothetical protein
MTPVTKIVRYRVAASRADENAALVRAVFDELAVSSPEGFRYATFRLDDGVTFVHVATIEGTNPLTASAAFARFQADIEARCEEGPVVTDATVVGSYALPYD